MVLDAPAGFGKTRLTTELCNSLSLLSQPTQVCEIQGTQSGRALARRIVSIIDAEKPTFKSTTLSRVRDWLNIPVSDDASKDDESVYRDVVTLLAAVSQKTRLLLVIEDIDRTNRRAAKLLESIVRQPIEIDVGVLVTTRSGSLRSGIVRTLRRHGDQSLREVTLEPLSPSHTRELVSFLATDPSHRAHVEGRAAGNPFFAQAYCKEVANATCKIVRNALWGMILKLDRRDRSVAETLSILRQPMAWNLVADMAGLPEAELRNAMDSLHEVGLANRNVLAIRYSDAKSLLEKSLSRSRRAELHAAAYYHLRNASSDEILLADHAFRGNLYQIAATLYRKLAREEFAQKHRGTPATYYALVIECRRRDPRVFSLDGSDIVKLATSYAHAGKRTTARRLLQSLLRTESVHEDGELLSAIHSGLASPLLEGSATERIKRLKLSITCLPLGSAQSIHRYRALTAAFLSAGDIDRAEETLMEAQEYCKSPEEIHELGDARAAILMSQGRFREAAHYLTSHKFQWTNPSVVPNNLAVCIEHTGDLKEARAKQLLALEGARGEGMLVVQILSLGNLGSMETKLGNLLEAEKCFSSAFRLFEELQRREGRSRRHLGIIFADAALHFLERGNLHAARQCIRKTNSDRIGISPTETLSIIHAHCYLEAALGQRRRAAKKLAEAQQLKLRGDFFDLQSLIAESRVLGPSKTLCDRLEQGVKISQRIGTPYQECQILISLTRSLLQAGELSEANRTSRRARRLASTNSYRSLEAEASMLVGLASKGSIRKEFFLTRSLNECVQMGLAVLAAECSFEIGSWRLSIGDSRGGIEYLSKSVSITSRLADDLSRVERRVYLNLRGHRAARDLLNTASKVSLPKSKEVPRLLLKDDSLSDLYCLAMAMNTCVDTESATRCLLETLNKSIDHLVTVAFESAGKMTFRSLRNISEQTKQRILSVSSSAGGKTYIAGTGTPPIRNTAVWVPFRSLTLSGGIYMECPHEAIIGPDEREIEFLTIVGTLAGAAFDQIVPKSVVQRPPSSMSHGIVGISQQIAAIRDQIDIAATNDANVLIEGESGTGKELVAKGIHEQSARAKGPFIPVDCGALPEELIEAELFGAKKGAYTGALSDRMGLFEAAHRGTIFLDEISNLSLAAQGKLLRVLQDREVRKIGSTVGRLIDVRLIAATNRNLDKLAQKGVFRRDLLFRLKVLYLFIPPLRDRHGDIPVLATAFLERLNSANQTTKYFGPGLLRKLSTHRYLGNVRELQNLVERAYYSARTVVVNEVDFLCESSTYGDSSHEAENWFTDLSEGGQDFWLAVHDPYKRRDLSREKIIALIDYGLRTTRGNYKAMASRLKIPKHEYRRFMDFLRRSKCLLDFRPYRKMDESST
jgi:DNA-binding NtrC family response regulator/tetratricopeptide (TPR) repeat protein